MRRVGSMRMVPLFTVLWLAASLAPLAAQNVETDPLQCWWRTSAGAIRIGEPFQVVLTCAVLETEAATVIVDQSRLEPSVVQFAPFEVLGGSHGVDLRTDQRRFFQYEYRLRLIAENLFGKDVALPDTKLSYHVQSRVGQKTSLQGRDQTYVLPAQSVRVLSLVPGDAADIRDTSTETFSDLDQRAFRANVFVVTGGVLFVLAGLMALLVLVRIVSRYRKPAAASDRLVTDATILRGVGREFAAVQRQREDGGWTPALAARALSALRIAGAFAIGQRVGHMPAGAEGLVEDGRLILLSGWPWGPRRKRIAVSGSITQQSVARDRAGSAATSNARRTLLLESLEQALTALTVAEFGQEAALNDSALDEALATGLQVLRRMKFEQLWIMKRLAAWRAGTAMDNRAWSR
jgi:hypothetical protein